MDDLSRPKRIEAQLLAAAARPGALVGARVSREPEGSTARYVAWANEMSEEELLLHRFRECTLLMPTWFMARGTFVRGGGFREEKCEDLLFLHAHVARGGSLHRVGGWARGAGGQGWQGGAGAGRGSHAPSHTPRFRRSGRRWWCTATTPPQSRT